MPSPFPGMDPYLEGYLWPDVHNALASKIRQQLTPHLRPRYVARLEISVAEEADPEQSLSVMFPDVEVVQVPPRPQPLFGGGMVAVADAPTVLAAPLTIPLLRHRIVTVQVRDAAQNRLVTSIETLSPVNKREPGLTKYRQKRERLADGEVHQLEIDLLRQGTRLLDNPRLRHVPYLVTLRRAAAGKLEVWPIRLPDPLPIVPVPLLHPDPDVPLDLGAALAAIYDEAAYDLSIDYSQPPAVPLANDEAAWLRPVLAEPAAPNDATPAVNS